jgi:hypothetical protein
VRFTVHIFSDDYVIISAHPKHDVFHSIPMPHSLNRPNATYYKHTETSVNEWFHNGFAGAGGEGDTHILPSTDRISVLESRFKPVAAHTNTLSADNSSPCTSLNGHLFYKKNVPNYANDIVKTYIYFVIIHLGSRWSIFQNTDNVQPERRRHADIIMDLHFYFSADC